MEAEQIEVGEVVLVLDQGKLTLGRIIGKPGRFVRLVGADFKELVVPERFILYRCKGAQESVHKGVVDLGQES